MGVRRTRRLALEERAAAADGGGGLTESWVERGVIWAEMKAMIGREQSLGLRPSSTVTHRARIRYAAPGAPDRPRADQRLREGARIYAIRAVAEADDRRAFLTLWLEEGALS